MEGDPPNSLQTPAHRTLGDPQEFEWSFQIDHRLRMKCRAQIQLFPHCPL